MLDLLGIPQKDEIRYARRDGVPLILAPSTIPSCNYKCFYCFVGDVERPKSLLTFKEHLSAIEQSSKMGAKYMIIGMEGEPFLDKTLYDPKTRSFPIIDAANEHGMYVLVFTNMSMLSPEILETLIQKEVSLVGKLNSLNYETNKKLISVSEDWVKYDSVRIPKGLKLMLDAGFNEATESNKTRLGIDIIISSINYRDIPSVVEFALKHQITPIVDSMVPVGRADENYRILRLTKMQNRWLYEQLVELLGEKFIDEEFVEGCAIRDGLAYDSSGNVKVCCTLDSDVGNIKETPIKELFERIQEFRRMLPDFEREEGVINSCKIAKYIQQKSRRTLIINSRTVEEIIKRTSLGEFMDAVIARIEDYFEQLNGDRVERLSRNGFLFGNNNVVESMFCRKRNSKVYVKIVNYHDRNFDRGLSAVMSTTLRLDEKSGFLEAIAESSLLTYIRTGAVAAIATKYLAKENIKKIGFIGTGSIAQLTLYALSRIYEKLERIYIWDIEEEALNTFKYRMEKLINIPIVIEEPEKFVSKVDVINTATYGNEIILKNEWINNGVHINAMGSDTKGKQEIDVEILKRSKIVADYKEQVIKEGELNVPISEGIISGNIIYGELHEIVAKEKEGRKDSREITLFDSTGDPIEDMAVLDLFIAYNDRLHCAEPVEFVLNLSNPKDPCAFLDDHLRTEELSELSYKSNFLFK